jgi:hypothetical protein
VKQVCYATVDTSRAVVALAAPFIAVIATMLMLIEKGYGVSDYPALIASGDIPWFPQVVGLLCLAFWIFRYVPPAWEALWYGPCIVSGDDKNLFLPGGHRISLKSVQAVTIHRSFLRKVAYLDRKQGRITLNLLFVRPSSDPLLRSIPKGEMPSP